MHFWGDPKPTSRGWLLPLTFRGPRYSAVPQSERPPFVWHVWGSQRQEVALLVQSHSFTKGWGCVSEEPRGGLSSPREKRQGRYLRNGHHTHRPGDTPQASRAPSAAPRLRTSQPGSRGLGGSPGAPGTAARAAPPTVHAHPAPPCPSAGVLSWVKGTRTTPPDCGPNVPGRALALGHPLNPRQGFRSPITQRGKPSLSTGSLLKVTGFGQRKDLNTGLSGSKPPFPGVLPHLPQAPQGSHSYQQ